MCMFVYVYAHATPVGLQFMSQQEIEYISPTMRRPHGRDLVVVGVGLVSLLGYFTVLT